VIRRISVGAFSVTNEMAPMACIVCNKAATDSLLAAKHSQWIYLAGVVPLGSLACSGECARVAIERFRFTGRTDAK
jgi:hypothetical protein